MFFKNACRSGFSLIELCVTIALVCLLATLSFSSANLFDRLLVRSEVDQLYAAAMYIQRCAQVGNCTQCIDINVDRGTYQVEGYTHQLSSRVKFGVLPGVKGPPSAPSKLISKAVTFDNNRISCAPTGIVQAGTIYLIDTQKQTMYALSSGVSQYSYLRKYYYDGSWHLIG